MTRPTMTKASHEAAAASAPQQERGQATRRQLLDAVLELSMAARADAALQRVIGDAERAISREVRELGPEVFGGAAAELPDFPRRWSLALSAIRGTAMLILLGHP